MPLEPLSSPVSRHHDILTARLAHALDMVDARRERRVLQPGSHSKDGAFVRDGRQLIDFASNDYLGLARRPELAERAAEWAGEAGSGSGSSRLVTGTLEHHSALERRIAAFKGTEAALLFPSGWHLNAAVLAALLKAAPETLLFTDRLIHGSLHAGAAGHRQIRFRHNDLAHLEAQLARHEGSPAPRLIVTESVFSMDGDRIDLPRLSAIARANNAFVYLDEAHATGVLGPEGRGLSGEWPGAADLVMGTFSKALGCFGAYVASSRMVIDYLVNCCGGFIYSTAPPPSMLGAIDAALDLVPTMDAERRTLASLGQRLRQRLQENGIDTLNSSTQIVPVIVGGPAQALAVSNALLARGMYAAAIRPPTVPPGTSRIRVALRSSHDDGDVDRLAAALIEAVRSSRP